MLKLVRVIGRDGSVPDCNALVAVVVGYCHLQSESQYLPWCCKLQVRI